MKILQNEQAATIYINGTKYEFVNGVCLKDEISAKDLEILKEYKYIVEEEKIVEPKADKKEIEKPKERKKKNVL